MQEFRVFYRSDATRNAMMRVEANSSFHARFAFLRAINEPRDIHSKVTYPQLDTIVVAVYGTTNITEVINV